MMRLHDTSICAVLILLAAYSSFSQPLHVIQLTSQTFEHQTQAATGQTTGHWCVLFYNTSNSNSKQQVVAEDAWEQLAADEEKTTIYAKVDVGRSTAVSSRFTIKSTPSAILFRDRAMYLVPWEESALSDADKLSAAVHSFVSTGYEEQEALAVPDVPSPLDAIKEFMSYLDIEPSITLFLGIGMMLFGLLTFLGFLISAMWMSQSPGPASTAATAAARSQTAKAASAPPAAAAGESPDAGEDKSAVDDDAQEAKATSRVTRRRA